MLPDQVSNPGPLTYESGALPIAPRGPAQTAQILMRWLIMSHLIRTFAVCILVFEFSI